jgi:hypothetical protein
MKVTLKISYRNMFGANIKLIAIRTVAGRSVVLAFEDGKLAKQYIN